MVAKLWGYGLLELELLLCELTETLELLELTDWLLELELLMEELLEEDGLLELELLPEESLLELELLLKSSIAYTRNSLPSGNVARGPKWLKLPVLN